MKKRLIIFTGIVICIGVIVYMVIGRKPDLVSAGPDGKIPEKYIVKRGTLRETFILSGKLDAQEKVSLIFQTGGRLSWVGVKEGDAVKKYQGIASLDVRQLQKDLQKKLNDYQTARTNFDQTKKDNKDAELTSGDTGEAMKRVIALSQYGLDNSVLNLELSTIAKEYAYLSTPIAGIVTRVDAQFPGVNVPMGTTYTVVNPETVYFAATADQTEVPKIQVGQSVQITIDAYPEEPLNATVQYVAFTPIESESGATYEVQIVFTSSNDTFKYRLGMTGDAEFVAKEKMNVLSVPLQFVRNEKDKKFVTLIRDGKPVKTEVTTGEEGDQEIEIARGLQEGDVLIDTK